MEYLLTIAVLLPLASAFLLFLFPANKPRTIRGLAIAATGVSLALIFSGCTGLKEHRVVAGVEIVEARFGVFQYQEKHNVIFTETNLVPLRSGVQYGWKIRLNTSQRMTLRVKNELTLPAPAEWLIVDTDLTPVDAKISRDGKRVTTERDADVQNGLLSHSWSVISTDPNGKYMVRVSLNGQLVKTFRFTLHPKAPLPKFQ